MSHLEYHSLLCIVLYGLYLLLLSKLVESLKNVDENTEFLNKNNEKYFSVEFSLKFSSNSRTGKNETKNTV